MFTGERIILSSRLGPTPGLRVGPAREGGGASGGRTPTCCAPTTTRRPSRPLLDALGVTYAVDLEPFPVFYNLSRRVPVEEVAGFREGAVPSEEADRPEP